MKARKCSSAGLPIKSLLGSPNWLPNRVLGQFFDRFIQAALMASSFVRVDQSFARHAINNRHSSFVGFRCSGFVARFNGGDHALNVGAHHRTLASVALAADFGLTGSFTSLSAIGHGSLFAVWGQKRRRIVLISSQQVNDFHSLGGNS